MTLRVLLAALVLALAAPASGAVIHGTHGDDIIYGTPGPDVIRAHRGDDIVYGLGGNDRIHGGHGSNRVHAGRGADLVVSISRKVERIFCGPGVDVQRDFGWALTRLYWCEQTW